MSASQEIDELREEIRKHDRLYYVDAAPVISDQQYDRLLDRLKQLEAENPELVTPDSPTQRVGGEPIEGFETVAHAQPMYSIDNTYDEQGLRKWGERCFEAISEELTGLDRGLEQLEAELDKQKGQRSAEATAARREIEDKKKALRDRREAALTRGAERGAIIEGGYFIEPKVDGVAVSLRYEKGRLVLAATRGDGQRGDDITQNARAIRSIPLLLSAADGRPIPEVLEVRGEIYMPEEDFKRINRLAECEGLEPMVNPRNGTAGTLKQYDPQIVAERGLRLMAHGCGEVSGEPFAAQGEMLEAFAAWGLPVNPFALPCPDLNAVWDAIQQFEADKEQLGYAVDGVVIKVNQFRAQTLLGYTSRFPRWCLAYKYATEQAETTLLEVEWQIGKTGKITPRGVMAPVFVAGTTVQHASLHNLGEVRRKDLRVGDTVVIEKAGEIIPQVVRVLKEKRPAGLKELRPPEVCPECGSDIEIEYDQRRRHEIDSWPAKVEREKQRAEKAGDEPREIPQPPELTELDESGRYCLNPECPAQLRERLEHFAARGQMDIDGLGEKLIAQLVEAGLLKTFGDVYALANRRDDVIALERVGAKKADNLFSAIEESKSRGLERVLAALGIRHVGATASRVLAGHFGSMSELSKASLDEIATFQVDGDESGIGPEIARSLHTFLHSQSGIAVVAELRDAEVLLEADQAAAPPAAGAALSGKTLVVTGTLTKYSRQEIEQLIRSHGGKASGSVSKTTDYLVAGEKAGSKLAKAEKMGVRVLSEADFEALIREE